MLDSKLFVRQLIGYFPSQVIPALSNLLIIIILTRSMTVENFGLYSLLITTVNLTVTIFTQWMMQSILFFRPKYETQKRIAEFDVVISKVYILLSAIIAVLLILSTTIIIAGIIDAKVIIPLLLIILFNSIFVINQTILQSDMRIGRYSTEIILLNFLRLISIVIVVAFFNSSLLLILWGTTFSYFLFVIPEYLIIIRKLTSGNFKSDIKTKDFLLEMLQYGLPMLGWFLAVSFFTITDRYILALYKSTYDVGLYSANIAVVSSALGLVFAPFIKVIHPIIMKAASESIIDNIAISNLITRFSLIFTVLGIPVLVIITLLRKEISELLLGATYIEGSIIIPYMLVGLFLWNLAMIGHKGFEVYKKTKQMFIYVVIACVFNIVFNFMLIPGMGIKGAGIAMLIAYSSYLILIKVNSNKSIYWRIPYYKAGLFILFGVLTYLLTTLVSGFYYNTNILYNIISTGVIAISFYILLSYLGLKILKINF